MPERKASECMVSKRSGSKQQMDVTKAIQSMVAAGCPHHKAQQIATRLLAGSTEDIRDHITAGLLEYDEVAAASRYKSYRAGFSASAMRVLRSRYLMRHEDGRTETPSEMLGRVAICMAMPLLAGRTPPHMVHGHTITPYHTLAYNTFCARHTKHHSQSFEDAVKSYHDIMMERRFLPNSPTLMNAGAPLGQLSACFVLDMPDNLDDIMSTVHETALIFQSGGGVGINYSQLRAAGSSISSTAGTASGPISFMGIIDKVGDVVKQGGRRRAANMGVLDASHPDIIQFIRAKRDGTKLTNFNISVGTDDAFWDAIISDTSYNGTTASHILDEVAESAHASAEPGLIFFDNIDRYNMLERARGRPVRTTNPCWGGETRVLTKDGPIPFRDLASRNNVKVLTREDDGTLSYRTMQNPGMTQQNADIVCLVLASKQTGECTALRCTPGHKVYVVSGASIQRRAVEDLTPNTTLASLYQDGAMYEQTIGVSISTNEIPDMVQKGTGHPTPSRLPLSLVSRKAKSKKAKKSADGFVTSDGVIPEAPTQHKKSGGLSRIFGRNHTVLAVIRLGHTDVYNGMVDETHNYFVECGDGHYILSANCGEQALYPNESCNLGSINLAEYAQDGTMQWDVLEADIRTCTRMLDGVVDMTRHPTIDIEQASNETRRIGLGVMGVADMLMYMGIPYNSTPAYKLFGHIAEFISYYSMDESVRMAAEAGPFPLYDMSGYVDGRLPFAGHTTPYHTWEHSSTLPWDDLISRIQEHGIRNVLTTTIAPTGTISMIAGCSSGIEPVFSLAYTKSVSVGSFQYGCSALAARHPDIIDMVAEAGGIIPYNMIPDADVYVTARQIHWADHIMAQAAWQRWIGNSISKTINMAEHTSISDVRAAYILAHSLGCRGLTIYRDGSRDTQVLEGGQTHYDIEPSVAAQQMI